MITGVAERVVFGLPVVFLKDKLRCGSSQCLMAPSSRGLGQRIFSP